MTACKIYSDRISSATLAHLTIADCYFHWKTRTRISTPGLVSLQLSVSEGMAPLLDKMPLLVEAKVTLEGLCDDTCEHNACKHGWRTRGLNDDCYCMDDDNGSGVYLENLSSCDSCYGRDDGSSVVLQALSEATDLELISNPRVVRFLFLFLFFFGTCRRAVYQYINILRRKKFKKHKVQPGF
jgi:hypothetical protein